jgi:hypothetical protein
MVGDLLRHFQFAAVFQIGGDTGRAEGMIANPRFEAGRFDIVVQTLIETTMTGNVVLLTAFGAESKNGSSTF